MSKLSDDIFLNSSSDGAKSNGPEIRQWFPSDTPENWDHNVKHNLKKLQEVCYLKLFGRYPNAPD